MRPFSTSLALIASAQSLSPAMAKSVEPLAMSPSSLWELEPSQDSCAVYRSFAGGPHEVTLAFRAFGPGETYEITAASRTISFKGNTIRTRFDPDDAYSTPWGIQLVAWDRLHGVRFSDSLKPAALKVPSRSVPVWPEAQRDARERAITGLAIAGVASQDITLRTGPMDRPMAALRTCVDDLLVRLGFDPAVQRSLSRLPKPVDQMAWARAMQEGLPREVNRVAGTGSARLRLILGPAGKPTACAALETSGASEFGGYACGIALKYARYEPALDADGRPVSTVVVTVANYSVF